MKSLSCLVLLALGLHFPSSAQAQFPTQTTMPLTDLPPAKIFPNLCGYHYRVSTTSEKCQEYVDQGLSFYYSYVWMEAARSFETAVMHDPNCAMAWWGLSKSLEKWRKKKGAEGALKNAQALLPQASYHEQQLITARLQEEGLIEGIKEEDRKKEAAKTLDDLLTLHDNDQEAWFARGQLAEGTGKIPYYKALLMINPLHPGANHELVHFYENWKKPALGWPYAAKFIESSPGIPHAWHMQAHLAMRIGKWQHTTDRSLHAVELEQAYHQFQNVDPRKDQQYSHHLEILTISLVHDGRFKEAREIQAATRRIGRKHWDVWFRIHRAERDWDAYEKLLEEYRKVSKSSASYYAALMYLDRDEADKAAPEVEALGEFWRKRKKDNKLKRQYWEVLGRHLCQTGKADNGLDLLKRAVDEAVNDFGAHSWGQGAYFMEAWGFAALRVGDVEQAEEAFLEALAHDAGSVRGAVGMEVLCGKLGRDEEARRFAMVADRCWNKADPGRLDQLRHEITELASNIPATTSSNVTSNEGS